MKLFYKRKSIANIAIDHLKVNFFVLRLEHKKKIDVYIRNSFPQCTGGPSHQIGKNNEERTNIRTENGDDVNFTYRNEFIKNSLDSKGKFSKIEKFTKLSI